MRAGWSRCGEWVSGVASCVSLLLPVRLRRFWKVDAVGSLVRAGPSRTVALPMGGALLGTTGFGSVDKANPAALHCVMWGFVDVSLRMVHVGEAEGASGVSKVLYLERICASAAVMPSTVANQRLLLLMMMLSLVVLRVHLLLLLSLDSMFLSLLSATL